jgi:Gluconate 2-dehydrogenase subunit 3
MSEERTDLPLSEDDERLLSSVLNEIIPSARQGKLPGAGDLGLTGFVERFVRTMPVLRPVIEQGLSTLARIAASHDARGFAPLCGEDKLALLDELTTADPAFLPTLTFVAYVGYYQDARVVEALGLEPQPPHPRGYEMEPNDLTLLEPVRRRPKMYREC